ncbi:polysaccharide lyase family 14 protein [Rhodofomes roseus]|uniref:Polysaccharide lyase family 14 protein n=1 Tax=Rhodofomes roseus TaxID=34475 RepID=A0ABQ8K5H6_9APHY|nr:polysaccharide lyase family 14 protein [Rhodofomes roseus]KAH9832210.1 polysaccharide lyase family 14 protein [Rhodofomes roseus]
MPRFIVSSCISALLLGMDVASAASSPIVPPASLASMYALTASTALPVPTSALSASDAASYLVSSWGLSNGKIQNGASNLAFVDDPFPNNSSTSLSDSADGNTTSPVLQVTYPAGSYSHDTGGAQFYALWNTSSNSSGSGENWNSMLVTYEVAFDADFDWVKGGKLPGLRGGPDVYGCSGGEAANGSNCFTSRTMWRTDGDGEVYAYALESKKFCDSSNVMCNDDGYGTSIDRGAFSFQSGAWNRVTMLVSLNNPVNKANGQVALYYNNVPAITLSSLQFRSTSDINIGGLFFSTFFGGSNSSWATPNTTHTYFRGFQMWASSAASNGTASSALKCQPRRWGPDSFSLSVGLLVFVYAML